MNTISKFGIAVSLLLLAACGGGIPGVTDDSGCISGCDNNGGPFTILAESSQTSDTGISPYGTWYTSCYVANDNQGNPAGYAREKIIFDIELDSNRVSTGRNLISYNISTYALSDTTCSSTIVASVDVFKDYLVEVESTVVMSGWMDGTGTVTTAPPKASGSGTLTAQPKVTILNVTNGTTSYSAIYYIDDTTSSHVMYRVNGSSVDYLSTEDSFK